MMQLQVKLGFLDWTRDGTASFVCSNMLTTGLLSENAQYRAMKERKERKEEKWREDW